MLSWATWEWVPGEGAALLGGKSCWRYFFINSLESVGYTGTRLTFLLFPGAIQHIAFYLEGPAISSSSSILPSPNPPSQASLKLLLHCIFSLPSYFWDLCSLKQRVRRVGLRGIPSFLEQLSCQSIASVWFPSLYVPTSQQMWAKLESLAVKWLLLLVFDTVKMCRTKWICLTSLTLIEKK